MNIRRHDPYILIPWILWDQREMVPWTRPTSKTRIHWLPVCPPSRTITWRYIITQSRLAGLACGRFGVICLRLFAISSDQELRLASGHFEISFSFIGKVIVIISFFFLLFPFWYKMVLPLFLFILFKL